jgi:hypothetical protein
MSDKGFYEITGKARMIGGHKTLDLPDRYTSQMLNETVQSFQVN